MAGLLGQQHYGLLGAPMSQGLLGRDPMNPYAPPAGGEVYWTPEQGQFFSGGTWPQGAPASAQGGDGYGAAWPKWTPLDVLLSILDRSKSALNQRKG